MEDWKKLNRFLQICLDIAEWHDKRGDEDHYWYGGELVKDIGLGYKALTGYLREGVKIVINLQGKCHYAEERRWIAESSEQDKQEFMREVFGEDEPETWNDEIKDKFKKAAREIIDEWDREHEV